MKALFGLDAATNSPRRQMSGWLAALPPLWLNVCLTGCLLDYDNKTSRNQRHADTIMILMVVIITLSKPMKQKKKYTNKTNPSSFSLFPDSSSPTLLLEQRISPAIIHLIVLINPSDHADDNLTTFRRNVLMTIIIAISTH